jgi:hypothetical protein
MEIPGTATPTRGFPPALIAGIVVLVIFVLIVVAAVSSFPTLPSSGGSVVVTQIMVQSSDDACGLEGATAPGFTTATGQTHPVGFGARSQYYPCTVNSVVSATPGFEVLGSFPVTVTSYSQIIAFSVLGTEAYDGVLDLAIS